MELRQLRYFASIYEEGSITKASRRLNVVQPAISTQLAKLEAEFGQKLFERSKMGLTPTLAGRKSYELFMPILREINHARNQIATLAKGVSGHVLAGFVTSVSNNALWRCVATCAERFPRIEITASDGYSTALIDAVMSRTVDIALINRPRGKMPLPFELVVEERMVLVSAPDNRIHTRKPVRLRELRSANLVLPTKRHGLRQIIDQQAGEHQTEFIPKAEIDSQAATIELVKTSKYVTILPRIAVYPDLANGSLVAHEIVDPEIKRELLWIYHPRRLPTEADRCFMSIVNEELLEAARPVAPTAKTASKWQQRRGRSQ